MTVRLMLYFFRRALAALRFSLAPPRTPAVPNFRIIMDGMHFPKGSVVPEHAFLSGVDGHLTIGSIEKTKDPVNVELPKPIATDPKGRPSDSESFASNAQDAIDQARSDLLVQAGKLAEVQNENEKLKAECERLTTENALLGTDLAAASALLEHREQSENPNAPIDPTK